jgi:hypothetical protein
MSLKIHCSRVTTQNGRGQRTLFVKTEEEEEEEEEEEGYYSYVNSSPAKALT